MRSASDAVGVVLKELKQQSHLGSFRLLVAVDGVNALWGRTTLKKEDKSPVRNALLWCCSCIPTAEGLALLAWRDLHNLVPES